MFGDVKPPGLCTESANRFQLLSSPPAPSEFPEGRGRAVRSNKDRRRLACALDGMNHQAGRANRGLSRRSVSIAGTVVVGGTD